MVAGTVAYPKAFRKRHGIKKVFSVPVGKLRSSINNPGRNGSRSRSTSGTKHRALLKNNRELARHLSNEKERFRKMVTDNVNLRTRLHDTQLEIRGLERRLCKSNQELVIYQDNVRHHLREAVKHSVSLTESLKQAMGLCHTEPKVKTPPLGTGHSYINTVASGSSISTSTNYPKQVVNPTIDGHTIRYPTISLKRVVMSNENRVAEKNVASSEEHVSESIDDDGDVSHNTPSIDETRERPGGLSTCLEEDEDDNADVNMNESTSEEEVSGEDDSIRRKIVSFRNTTFEKDNNTLGLEADRSNSPSETLTQQAIESDVIKQGESQNSNMPNDHKQSSVVDSNLQPHDSRNPVVALNDISRFLQNSNSVNVQKMILDMDSHKSSNHIGVGANEISASEKENFPNTAPSTSLVTPKLLLSGELNSHPLKVNDELCQEGRTEKSIFVHDEKKGTVVKVCSAPYMLEDPLEGTSWMHLHLFSDSKKNPKKGKSRKYVTSETKPKCKNLRSHGKTENGLKEKISEFSLKNQSQEEGRVVEESLKSPIGECDVSDFDAGLKNCPIAQSTPMNPGKPSQNSSASSVADVLKSASKSNKNINSSSTSILLGGYSSPKNNQVKEREKSLGFPLTDTKLDKKAFVTVRVKRLELADLTDTNGLTVIPHESDDYINLSDEEVDFLGCGARSEVQDVIVLCSDVCRKSELESRNFYRNSTTDSIPSTCSGSITHDSAYIDGESYNGSSSEIRRPRRRAAPKILKEPGLNKKLRQEATKKKSRTVK